MKKLVLILLITVLAACTNQKSPDKVAVKFLNAVAAQKYERAKKFSTQRTVSMLDVLQSLNAIAPNKGKPKKYEVIDYQISGSFAVVKYKEIGAEAIEQLRMVKENEEWKVGTMPDLNDAEEVSSI